MVFVDNAPQYALGEDIDGDGSNGGSDKIAVELSGTVAAGDALIIVGGAVTDDLPTAAKNTTGVATLTSGVATKAGVSGDTIIMLTRGRTKVPAGGAIALNALLGIIVTSSFFITNVALAYIVGKALQPAVASGDYFLIYLNCQSGGAIS